MKKFLLHIDGSKEQSLYGLYLAHVANSNLEDLEFNVLRPKGDKGIDFLKFSPFEIQIHDYDLNKITSMPKAHKFAYNLHDVFNIDYFVDFGCSATSAFWGTAFRAINRIGKASRLRNLLLSKNFEVSNDWEYFESLLAYFDWNFNFTEIQKEFEINGDDVLIFETAINTNFRKKIEEKFNVIQLNQEKVDEFETLIRNLEKIQYVFVNSKDDIALFSYLNKIVVFDREESSGDILTYADFKERHLDID